MNSTSSPSVVSLTEWRAAKRDPVASSGSADARAEAAMPDRGLTAVLAAVLEGEAVEPQKGDRLRHSLVQDWLTLLLIRPEVADLTQDDQRNGPWDMAPGLHVAGRTAHTHRGSVSHLEQLAPQLIDELERITLPFSDSAPGDAELRIAQTQLDDWLQQLSHDIQAELFALQMAAQRQLLSITDLAAATRQRAVNAGPDRPSHGLDPGMPAPGRRYLE
jgi:Bacterial proteasome activator